MKNPAKSRTVTTAATLLRADQASDPTAGGWWLVVIGAEEVEKHPLPTAGQVTIGRSRRADVSIDDPSISREHATLRMGAEMTIEDLGSANGTRVRGAPVKAGTPVAVAAGEAIELGGIMVIVQRRVAAAPPPRRIWNHGYFEGRVDDECLRAEPSAQFAVFALKSAEQNATRIEQAMAGQLGQTDVLGTYAPGQYEVLRIRTSPEEAKRVAKEYRAVIAEHGIEARIGVAGFPGDGRTADELIATAHLRALDGPARGQSELPPEVSLASMNQLHRIMERISAGMISVLILGETGVGKEVLAERVHRMSPRAPHQFLRLNCAALSESLLESELFGHERGAFTGAMHTKPGLLETANGGTVFLDEVGELPPATQVKLLRVIEERQVLRVGGLKPRNIDVRFVSATNRDLETEAGRGSFRSDLYYRLNGFSIVIPPLRERVGEIESLASVFIKQASTKQGRKREPALSKEALMALSRYPWPGNIRELRNVIERAVLLCTGEEITSHHLPLEKMRAAPAVPPRAEPPPPAPAQAASGRPASPTAIRDELKMLERERIVDALKRCGGSQVRAAELLGIPRRTLIKRLDSYGIDRPRKGRSP